MSEKLRKDASKYSDVRVLTTQRYAFYITQSWPGPMYRVYKIISPDISYRFERFIEMNEYVKLRSNRGKMVSLISIDRGRGYFRPTFFLGTGSVCIRREKKRHRERVRERERTAHDNFDF